MPKRGASIADLVIFKTKVVKVGVKHAQPVIIPIVMHNQGVNIVRMESIKDLRRNQAARTALAVSIPTKMHRPAARDALLATINQMEGLHRVPLVDPGSTAIKTCVHHAKVVCRVNISLQMLKLLVPIVQGANTQTKMHG